MPLRGTEHLSRLLSHLQQVVDQMPAAVYVCEAPSGVIRLYNQRAAEFWGRAPRPGDTEERFCSAFRLFRPDGRLLPHAETPMAEALLGASTRDGEVVIERPDGSRLAVRVNIAPLRDPDGQIIGAINAFQDITDRKQAEEAARMAAIVATAGDAIISTTLDGTITSWNRAAVRMFGWTSADALGRHIALIIPENQHAEEVDVVARIRRSEAVDHFETIRLAKDGRLVDVSLTVSPVRDATGHVIGASQVARDITERKRTEEELRRSECERDALLAREQSARAEAEAASRAKDEFLAMLAHELRNPLSVVINAAAVLGATPLPPPAERAHAAIGRHTQHLSRMLDDLLDVGRITRGHIELERDQVDLRAVAEQAIEAQRYQIDAKRQRLVTTLPDRPIVVVGDVVRLQQVVSNLLNNAAKYTPAGGNVWLSLEADTDAAVLRVRDDGGGILPDKLHSIFDLFAQANPTLARTEGGLGVGLTLVNRLVELHGGSVHALSDGPGRGAEFVVRIPLAPLVTTTVAPAMMPGAGVAKRVLVVEDNDDGREMLVTTLRLYGHEVYEARTGDEAVKEAARQAPDVVLVDIGLPDMDGCEVARRIRRQLGPDVRLVALTGYGQPDDRERSARAGFARHLVKPVDPAKLDEILQAL